MSEVITKLDLAQILGTAKRETDGTMTFLNGYTQTSGNILTNADLGAMLASAERDDDGILVFMPTKS